MFKKNKCQSWGVHSILLTPNPGAPNTQICPREDCHLVGKARLTRRNPLEKNTSSTKSNAYNSRDQDS